MRNLQFKSLPMTEDVALTSQLITSDPAVPDPEVKATKPRWQLCTVNFCKGY